jgi:hypothetical protein
VVQPPQEVVGTITAESEIDRLVGFEVSIPDLDSDGLKVLCDRISDHQEVDIAFAHLADVLRVTGEPPFLDTSLGRNRRVLRLCLDWFELKDGNRRDGHDKG